MEFYTNLEDGPITLSPFEDCHVDGLRSACAKDRDIWEIYPVSMLGEHFDSTLAKMATMSGWLRYAILDESSVVGMTAYINSDLAKKCVEIGGTYIEPRLRGTGCNRRIKRLMIEHAFAQGFEAIVFKVDTRNERSKHAVQKLGATFDGILKRNMTTWTGYVRDTAVFRLTPARWNARQASSGHRT